MSRGNFRHQQHQGDQMSYPSSWHRSSDGEFTRPAVVDLGYNNDARVKDGNTNIFLPQPLPQRYPAAPAARLVNPALEETIARRSDRQSLSLPTANVVASSYRTNEAVSFPSQYPYAGGRSYNTDTSGSRGTVSLT